MPISLEKSHDLNTIGSSYSRNSQHRRYFVLSTAAVVVFGIYVLSRTPFREYNDTTIHSKPPEQFKHRVQQVVNYALGKESGGFANSFISLNNEKLLPRTRILNHTPGFTTFERLYVHNGVGFRL